ncbi:hypothetical protein B0H16DRAFT_1737982 [Mycena metata]|uniref:Uncharacterized protein n=1 Tax=Mycena metata TaxID=1033252 RepID=A0AAD7MKP5_9AGAR|nr:hypothetical protein B0H16DRAFT_1737982 [Mycena metata]
MKLLVVFFPFIAVATALALPIVNLESIADLKRNCGLPCTCPASAPMMVDLTEKAMERALATR